MLRALVVVFSIVGLVHLFKDNSGPFDVLAKARVLLFSNKYLGVFFFKLFECIFCISCWAGAAVYFLYNHHYSIRTFILWVLMGGAIGMLQEAVFNRLYRQ